ncbi:hypothetical protein DMENIID0001_017750 [Sergentomyia squamirostris]
MLSVKEDQVDKLQALLSPRDVQLLAIRNPRSPVCIIVCALQEIGFQFPREAGVRFRDRPANVEIDWSFHEELKGYDKEYWSLVAPSMATERGATFGDGAHWDSTFDFSEEKSLRNVCVMSDSLSGLQALQSAMKEFEVPTLTEIDLLYQTGRSVRLIWVPSHVGIAGNERADRCARHAAEGVPDNSEVLRTEDWNAQYSISCSKQKQSGIEETSFDGEWATEEYGKG